MRAALLLGVFVSLGCGLPTAVRPVPKGVLQPELGFGGPVARIAGIHMPVPLSAAGARYGIAEGLDVSAHLHLTSLAFDVAGLDVGGTWLAAEQQGWVPAVALSGRLYGFAELSVGQPSAYLELTPSASWRANDWLTPYVAGSTLVQFAGAWPQWSLQAGAEGRWGAFGVQLELRWYAPHLPSRFMVVRWAEAGGQGALGAVFAVSHRFGGAR